ncbi:MAG: indolepyruvate oxidoreductase subunit beta [Desulfarculaceae bacterium]|jgi:indolepyruvate ferredoxin oxidoreductase beta subunit
MKALACEPLDLVVTGVGGQGNVLASQVLGRALLAAGYTVTVGETFGLSQRGGAVMSQVRVTTGRILGPLIPEHRATAMVGLEPLESLRVLAQYGNPDIVVFSNDRPLLPLNVISGESTYPQMEELRQALEKLSRRLFWLPATDVALELGAPILANVVMLGALAASDLLPIGNEQIEEALAGLFPPEKMPANQKALQRGRELLASAGG